MEIVSVIIADDHEIFRKGLIAVLNEISFVKVVAEASNGNELLRIMQKIHADIVLMDIKMPIMDGIEATKKVTELFPQTQVITLTMQEGIGYFNKMIEAGAKGFLLKNTNREQLEAAIDAVSNGNQFFSEEFESLTNIAPIISKKINIDISDREKQVLELICKGLSNAEIADKLGLSQRTVDGHKAHLFEKTGAKNSANLVLFAIKNGIIKP